MVNFRLQLVNRQNVADIINLNLPSVEAIPISITFQVADIRTPEKRNGSMSKTIRIPLTKEAIIFFEFAFDANIDLQTFNPNKIVDAYYFKKEVKQFDGRLQLNKIILNELTKNGYFECQIVGREIGLFSAINNKLLTDIDFTAYDTGSGVVNYTHTLTAANVANSWATTPGVSYVYPFIDWGVNNSQMNFVKPQHLRGCFFARAYLFAIFRMAGYTWTSAFLDSAFFKRLIIPPTELPALSPTVFNNNKFRAESDGTQTIANTFTNASFPILQFLAATTYTDVAFQTEIYDTGNVFATPTWTCATTNKHNVNANLGISFVFKKNGVATASNLWTGVSGLITVILSGAVYGMVQLPILGMDFTQPQYFSIPLVNYQVAASATTKVKIRFEASNILTASAGSGADVWTIETTILTGSNFSAEFTSASVYEGISVNPNDLIPINIKQTDFVTSLRKMFNLYFQVDRDNPNNLIIEPREDFYLNTSRNWTAKKDWSKDRTVIPLGDLDANKLTYSYKEDGDYYNKLHQDLFKKTYGYDEIIFDNDFVRGDKPIDVIFSASPYAVNPNLPAVIPQILTKDNGTIKECKPNIRILYWSGMIALPSSQWTLTNNGAPYAVYASIPHAGHTDNPYNPTVDINWGFPKKIYAPTGILPSTWTNNNLKNKYYSVNEQQISDPNSKIIIDHFVLTENDINTLDFRYPIFVDDTYYLINKIPDFDPSIEESVPVELMKLTQFDPFVPVSVDLTGDDTDNQNQNFAFNNNVSNSPNSTNLGNDSMITGGNDNFIAYG